MKNSTPRPTSASTEREWARGFIHQLQATEDEIPEGFRTAVEWAELWDRSRFYASQLIRLGIRKGQMEQKNFRRKIAPNVIMKLPHYRITSPRDPRPSDTSKRPRQGKRR